MRFKDFLEITEPGDNNDLLMQLRNAQLPIPYNWDEMSPMAKRMHVYWVVQQKAIRQDAAARARSAETQPHASMPAPTPPPIPSSPWKRWFSGQ